MFLLNSKIVYKKGFYIIMAKRGYRTFMYTCNYTEVPQHFKTEESVNSYLSDNMPKGTQWAWICHWQDVYTEEDERNNSNHKAGAKKAPHIHISVYLPNAKSIPAMAKCFGDDRIQNTQKFTGDNAKQNVFSYLVHKTEGSKLDGKFIYDYKDVRTNFNYETYVESVGTAIASAKLDKDMVQAMILSGELRFIDFIMNDMYTSFYLANKTFVTTAIDTLYKRRMNDRNRDKVTVLYIQGEAGSGKTHYAKHYALKNYRDYCISSSSNDSTQDYLGQDVMIFDDARPSDFCASDWLKLLDPFNNESSVNSRYYNKYLAVKCIIITSVTPFEEFFVYSPQKDSSDLLEPVGQFMRRFDYVLKAYRVEEADILSTLLNVYNIEPCKKAIELQVGNRYVKYVHKLSDVPVKTLKNVIGRIHNSGSDEILATF